MQQQEEKEQGKPELKETLNFSRLQEEHAKVRPEFSCQPFFATHAARFSL